MLGKMPLSVIEADVNFNKNKTNKNPRQQMNEQTGKKKSFPAQWNYKNMGKYLWYNVIW